MYDFSTNVCYVPVISMSSVSWDFNMLTLFIYEILGGLIWVIVN